MIRSLILPALCCCYAYAADIVTEFPWSKDIPADIVEAHLKPTQLADEVPCDPRAALQEIMLPVIKDCKTAREAALLIAPKMTELTGVNYSTERRKPCMNALESLAEKKASCTGLSILFASTMRSIGIPCRLVGVLCWNHVVGNHSWTEVYLDGEWQMLEFGQEDFNTGWVMEACGMLDSSQLAQRVMATTGKEKVGDNNYFPLPWAIHNHTVGAEDISLRYRQLATEWYANNDLPAGTQRLMVDLVPRPAEETIVKLLNNKGELIDSGAISAPTDDMRQMLKLNLPREVKEGTFYALRFPDGRTLRVDPTETPVQVLRFRAKTQK